MSKKLKEVLRKINLSTPQGIRNTIWIVATALLVNLVLFGGYYYWDRYIHLWDQSQVEMTIEALEKAIRDDPTDPEKRVMLAEYYLSRNEPAKALAQTEQVLDAYPEHESALLITGIAHIKRDQPEKALDPLQHFVILRKDLPLANSDSALETAYYFLGESYLKLERPADAISSLEAAIQISSTDADALYLLGMAYNATGKPEQALPNFTRAVQLVPDFVEAYSGMQASYTALEQPEYIAYARGMQAFCMHDLETARSSLEYAAQVLPDHSPTFLGLALTYEQLEFFDLALISINHALELEPENFAAQQTLGRLQATVAALEPK